jgi:hypothetical protein
MICPCCGQAVTPPGRLQGLMAELGPVSGSVLQELLAASSPLSGRDLADRVYRGVVDGGPESAAQVICMVVRRLRPRLEALGWTIRSSAWTGYRLVPIEAQET